MSNPYSSQEEVLSAAREGDAEAQKMFVTGELNQLPLRTEVVEQESEGSAEMPVEEAPIETQPIVEEEIVESVEPTQEVEPNSETDYDAEAIAKARAEYDARVENEARMQEQFQSMLDQQKAEAKEAENHLLKEINELKTKRESDSFYEENMSLSEQVSNLEAEASNDLQGTGQVSPEVLKEIQAIKDAQAISDERWRENELERDMERKLGEYRSFFDTSYGNAFKPEGDIKDAMYDFNSFLFKLQDSKGDINANRLMFDLVKGKTPYAYEEVERLGLEIPNNLDKLFGLWELEQFKNGLRFEPTGEIKEMRNSPYTRLSLEEIATLQNKDTQAQRNFARQANQKISQLSSRVSSPPAEYRPIGGGTDFRDPSVRASILEAAHRSGYRGDGNLSRIDRSTQAGDLAFNNMASLEAFKVKLMNKG
ncbi:MAG: hypothetical protein GY941_22150 [Planctomycetes bacterium]|nr:hypothetical protein [Planctomycetota bacterium]